MKLFPSFWLTHELAARAPSAYNLFMKDRLKPYREANPGVSNKDAMKAVCHFKL